MQDILGGREADAEAAQHQARDIWRSGPFACGAHLACSLLIAYWAAWADALPVLQQRCPEAVERCLQELEAGNQAAAAAGVHTARQAAPSEDCVRAAARHRVGGAKAMCNGIIVVTCEPFREVEREGLEEEVNAGHRAEMKQQPGCLQAVTPWDTAEQRVMLGALEAESLADVGFVAERRAEYQEPLLRGREGPVANPDGLQDVAGQVSDGRGLLTCRIPDACLASMKLDAGVLPQGCAQRIQQGRTRSGLATM